MGISLGHGGTVKTDQEPAALASGILQKPLFLIQSSLSFETRSQSSHFRVQVTVVFL